MLHAFVVMGNHDHLAVETRTTDPPIPRAIFDPKSANPAGWPATPTNGFQPDSPKPILGRGSNHRAEDFLNAFSVLTGEREVV